MLSWYILTYGNASFLVSNLRVLLAVLGVKFAVIYNACKHVQHLSIEIKTHLYAAFHLSLCPVLFPGCLPLVISKPGVAHCIILTLLVNNLACSSMAVCALTLFCTSMVHVHASTVLAHALTGLIHASMVFAGLLTVLPHASMVLAHASMFLARDSTGLTCASMVQALNSVAADDVSSRLLHETRYCQSFIASVSTSVLVQTRD